MKNKEEFLNKIIDDLPIAEYRSQMTKDEWKGWFEDAYNEGYKQAQALQLQQTGVVRSCFDEIYSDLTTISASLLTKKLSEFEEDWNFCKTTPKKDIYKILNNVEFQNSIQRSLANKLSSVKDKFFKHYR